MISIGSILRAPESLLAARASLTMRIDPRDLLNRSFFVGEAKSTISSAVTINSLHAQAPCITRVDLRGFEWTINLFLKDAITLIPVQ